MDPEFERCRVTLPYEVLRGRKAWEKTVTISILKALEKVASSAKTGCSAI